MDNLEEVEIVTADGQIRTASRDKNTELFWALRGGGGNFGVVTRFTFRLHEVGPTVTGGLIVWSAERVDDVLATYRDLTASGAARVDRGRDRAPGAAGPVPSREVARQARSSGCSSATAALTRKATSPRFAPSATRSPTSSPSKPYTDQQSLLDGMEPNGHRYYWKTEYLAALTTEFLDSFRDSALKVDVPAVRVHRHPPRG